MDVAGNAAAPLVVIISDWIPMTQSNGMDSSSPKRHLGAKLVSDTTSKRKGGVTMKLSRVGVDLAKNVYQLHGEVDSTAVRQALRKK